MNQDVADPDVTLVSEANADFSFRLLHELADCQAEGNVFFSPFSISNALTMALNGMGGQTQQDMAQALGQAAAGMDRVNQGNGLLLPMLTRPDPKVEVLIANALWANHDVTLAPDFVELCRRFYDASAANLNFASPDAVNTINEWVSQNTRGKITQIVSQRALAAAPVVLTNAVYFHGKWQTPFKRAATQSAPFTLDSGGARSVEMMCQGGTLAYLEAAHFQAVSLPYGDGRFRLSVLLPKPGKSVDDLAADLNGPMWKELTGYMKPTYLTLYLPRFKAEYQAGLRTPLSSLGMGAAFDSSADLRPMGLNRSFIGEVIHKALVEVDEEGTVAAAVTATVGFTMQKGDRPPPIIMRVDHPFFIAIRDNVTGTILFAGVIRDPGLSQWTRPQASAPEQETSETPVAADSETTQAVLVRASAPTSKASDVPPPPRDTSQYPPSRYVPGRLWRK